MPLTVVMLGPPASGKGTQTARLAQARQIPKIATGDILREAAQSGTEVGRRAKALMDRGELLGDAEIIAIVRERLSRPDTAAGCILDGFPRTVAQAESLDGMRPEGPLVIIDLVVPTDELLRRMQARRVCRACASIAEPGTDRDQCARCGGRLMTRSDDEDAKVRQHRLDVYTRETRPLVDYYRGRPTYLAIDGTQTPDRVARELAAHLDAVAPLAPERRA